MSTTDTTQVRAALAALSPNEALEVVRDVATERGADFARAVLSAGRAALDGLPYGGEGAALRYVANETPDADDVLHDSADTLNRRAYYGYVRGVAEEIDEEARDRIRDGEDADDVRDWESERIHEAADGSWWVTYTHATIRALLASSNWLAVEDAGFLADLGGEDDLSRVLTVSAFCALEADIREHVSDPDDLAEEVEEERTEAAGTVATALDLPEIREEWEALSEVRPDAVDLSDLLDDRDADAAARILFRLRDRDGPGDRPAAVEAVRVLLNVEADKLPAPQDPEDEDA